MSFPCWLYEPFNKPNPIMSPGANPPPTWLIVMATIGFFLAVMLQGCL